MTIRNVELCQLRDKNYINDQCTEYTESEIFGRRVIQANPGTPVSEEIADIFRNYYIDRENMQSKDFDWHQQPAL